MPEETAKTALLHKLNILKEAYIKLLNDKDVLLNWGKPQLEALYATKIGVWLVSRLQAQLRIKALKLKIEKLTAAINRQEKIDLIQIELDVAAALVEAEARIMTDAAKIESAKHLLTHLDSPQRSSDLRKLYRELARQLHPDVNAHLTAEQIQLWHLVKEAYENGDLENLRAMHIVYEKELSQVSAKEKELTEDQITLQSAALKEGIKCLQEELLKIKSLFPFTIEKNIKDDEWVHEQTEMLKAELEKLKQFEEELTLKFHQMVSLI